VAVSGSEERDEMEKKTVRLLVKVLGTAPFLGCLAGLMLLATGCGSKVAKPSAKQARAFDSAPAAVKQVWDKALKAETDKEYLAAEDSFENLQKMELTSDQTNALNAEFLDFHKQLYQAAENGDSGAVKAVQKINSSNKR
jgi:hypothetical protein